jgi:hypothetical protein
MPYQGRLPYTYKSPYNYTLDQGTQTVPSLAFLGDTNNGLFSPATDNVAITTNGSEKLRVTSAGNVGIGTTNPNCRFQAQIQTTALVNGDTVNSYRIARFMNLSSDGAGRGIEFGAPTGSVVSPVYIKVVSTGARFSIVNQTDSENLTILDSGNVGIGTTNPSQKLDVYGAGDISAVFKSTNAGSEISLDATNGYASLRIFDSGTEKWRIGHVGQSNDFQIWQIGAGERVRITSSGNVGIGTTNPIAFSGQTHHTVNYSGDGTQVSGYNLMVNGTRYASFISYPSNSEALRISSHSASLPMIFQTNDQTRITIKADGNVGIGTTNPISKLHVANSSTEFMIYTSSGNLELYGPEIWDSPSYMRIGASYNNLGLYCSDTMHFNTSNIGGYVFGQNGTGHTYINANGNVGIGTTNPGTKLDVDGAITSRLTGASGGFRLHTNSGIVAADNVVRFFTGQAYGFNFNSNTTGDSTSPLMSITLAGNVGIGTTNPVSGLSVTKSGTLFFADSVWMQPSGNTLITARGASGQDNWMGIGGHYYATSGSANLLLQANFGDLGSVVGHYISSTATGIGSSYFSIGRMIAGGGIGTPAAKQPQLNIDVSGNVGIGTTNPLKPLDVRGEATFGAGVLISDLNWGKDTHQLVHTFSGTAGGGNPSDGVIALVSPNANPSNTRIGSIVYGNKVSGTSATLNPGIKAVIDCYTNTNVTNAADTGANLNFYTKPDNAGNRLQMTLNSNGVLTKPYQPAFLAYRNTTLSVITTWQNISQGILTESYDVGSVYSTSTNGRFVAPVAGKYMFYAGGYSMGSSNGERYAFGVKVNNAGSPDFITGGNYCLTDTPLAPYQIVLNLAANDYVELFFFSAISTTIGGSPHVLYWGGYLLG